MQAAVLVFQQRPYSFLTGNCHSFVAHVLNAVAFDGSERWNAVGLTLRMLRRGQTVGWAGFARQWGPFAVIATLGTYFTGWLFLAFWLACFAVSSGWFVGHSLLSRSDGSQPEVPQSLHPAYTV